MDRDYCNWFAGLADGEGCFLIQNTTKDYFQFTFRISMRLDDAPMLKDAVKKLGVGHFVLQQRKEYYQGGHWHKPTCAYKVSSVQGCLKLIEIFDKHPLRSKKKRDYLIWRAAVLEAAKVTGIKNADRSIFFKYMDDIVSIRKYGVL